MCSGAGPVRNVEIGTKQENCRYPPSAFLKATYLFTGQRTPSDGVIAIAQPFLQDLIAANATLPNGIRYVSPVSNSVEEDVIRARTDCSRMRCGGSLLREGPRRGRCQEQIPSSSLSQSAQKNDFRAKISWRLSAQRFVGCDEIAAALLR